VEKDQIQNLRRSNMPFYYYKASQLDHLESMAFKINTPAVKKTLASYMTEYAQILSEFK
jgi:hypothetical protein